MTDSVNPPAAELRHRLVVDTARRELSRLTYDDHILEASRTLSGMEMAKALGTAERLAARRAVTLGRRGEQFKEEALINRLITESVINPELRPAVIKRLHEMKLSMGYMPDPLGDVFVSESGAAVEEARRRGWVSEDEFDAIFRR